MKGWILKTGLLLFLGFTASGCMVSGGLVIEPEPIIIGDPPRHAEHRAKQSRKHNRSHFRIPLGHMPPRGKCRVWYVDRPPGHQPPAVSCHRIGRRVPPNAVIIRGR
ncbi:hypothetical protein [Rhodohalobacter barkolensis]|uniref:Lipoprotein n=1 Tax=Rhodohalobacter barkolensis TaxID=2053187 RepID=A0A2N0VH29_9BACT|nr:hypothetical protein [Rhodohalobacter barkolensis]PKD43448.1 hypothetical protein CWD77_07705 [Rhodohalobacter barkolensis]